MEEPLLVLLSEPLIVMFLLCLSVIQIERAIDGSVASKLCLVRQAGVAVSQNYFSLAHLEDCRDQEKDKTRNGRGHSDDMERRPAIAKLLLVPR